MHFVNTERSNKVVIYFDRSLIFVCSGSAVVPAVRSAVVRRLDRRRRQEAEAIFGWLDRAIYISQTDGFGLVRPANLLRSDRNSSI